MDLRTTVDVLCGIIDVNSIGVKDRSALSL